MKSLFALFCGHLFLICGCSPTLVQPPAPAVSSALPPLLLSPQPLHAVELAPEAIPAWRKLRQSRPALLLLSADPMLTPIPDSLRSDVALLTERGDEGSFRVTAKRQVSNPLLLQDQTVSAAIQNDLISELVWIIPTQSDNQEISLEIFREQLITAGIATPGEVESFQQAGNVVTGQIRNLPFRCTSLRNLPNLEGPVILHLDLTYFANRYENEVTTPIFSLIHDVLTALRQTRITVATSTLSISTEENEAPLEFRFLKDVLASVFARPGLLDEPLPKEWELRKEARYFESFFQPQAVLERYLRLCEIEPESASAEFDTYRAFATLKEDNEAEKHLVRAIQKDSGYAHEYINLALMSSKSPPEKLLHLQKAIDIFPANPFLRLEKLNLLIGLGQLEPAKDLLDSLDFEQWSQIYYPEIPPILTELRKTLVRSTNEQ